MLILSLLIFFSVVLITMKIGKIITSADNIHHHQLNCMCSDSWLYTIIINNEYNIAYIQNIISDVNNIMLGEISNNNMYFINNHPLILFQTTAR
ncbi:hypothetical protein J5751_07390 [bacterium]|nr:hypothetical protein [bacterium]